MRLRHTNLLVCQKIIPRRQNGVAWKHIVLPVKMPAKDAEQVIGEIFCLATLGQVWDEL